jgi:UDP-2,4-diacetamido-2,4,6-trideoxy-beta-L-altropyranose hydrolase
VAGPAGDVACFRVDASNEIGTGHLMRCLALADDLAASGGACHFIGCTAPPHLQELVRRRGHALHELTAVAGSAADAAATASIVAETRATLLIIDHYGLDRAWERELTGRCRRLMVIDDLANRPHECDLLLDQNLGRSAADYAGLVGARCRVLAGPDYALLRPEFAARRAASLERRAAGALGRLLVSLGGVDAPNATGQVLAALAGAALPSDLRVDVIMGGGAPWLAEVRTRAAQLPWVAEVHAGVTDMADLMAASDAAIGAAGISAWERCCLGIPTVLVVLADNQWPGARALSRSGAALLVGEVSAVPAELPRALGALADSTTLGRMSKIAARIADGQGVQRVIRELRANGE